MKHACLLALLLSGLVSGCIVSFPDDLRSQGAGESSGGQGTGGEGNGAGDAGSGGGNDGQEDCFNGIDDDNDGQTDCADQESCGFAVSVPTAPLGWQGPVTLTSETSAPSCEGSWSEVVVPIAETAYQAGPTSCGCDCGAPNTGYKCPSVDVTFYDQNACSANPLGPITRLAGTCQASFSPPATSKGSFIATVAPPSGGTCAPADNTVTPPLTFETRGVCGTAMVGVGELTDTICAPPPSGDSTGAICVLAPGDNACPGGSPFTERVVLYDSHEDQRGCDVPCTCAAPMGGSCTGGVRAYSMTACSSLKDQDDADGTCKTIGLGPGLASFDVFVDPPTGGSCTPATRMAVGGVLGQNPTTVCCTLPL